MDRNTEISAGEREEQLAYTEKIRGILQQRFTSPMAYVDTYGCQQNESDSEKLRAMLIDMGCGMTSDEFEADIVVINSCAIREHAEQRVLGNVGALVHTRNAKRTQIIVFCGCLAGVPETVEKLRSSYPHVRLVFPPNQLWRFPELLYKTMESFYSRPRGRRVFIEDTEHAPVAEGLASHRESVVKAWLPIMYGCNNFCAYCIVPYVRGRERSRSAAKVLDEARELVEAGYKDITLLGQNVNSYRGKGLNGTAETVDFPGLIREICKIDGDFLVRFMTSHPKDASEELFRAMAESDKMARHIHLPFQSGSDRILELMNRKYTAEQYLEKIAFARSLMPELVITSDVIVGFPGETQEDFDDTMRLVEKADFEAMFTFLYSKRPGTPAEAFDDTVSREEKQERFERLVELQNEISERKHAQYVGKTVRVLVDGEAPDEVYPLKARTNGSRLVHLSGSRELLGSFVDAKITHSNNWSLYGVMENGKQ